MSKHTAARELRILSPTGALGSGFLESSFNAALEQQPHVIGCDAGTTDGGPFALGAGKPSFPRLAVKRDLRLILLGARRIKVPLLIGSCGTAGGEVHLQIVHEIVREIAREEGLSFKLALIHAEQDKDYLKTRLRQGRIKPLHPAPEFDEEVIDRSERIVGMMGTEPYVRALEMGVEVILAGRSSDTSMFCALPHMHGFSAGIALHAAKILECGTAAVVQRKTPDCMLATIRDDHFEIGPLDPDLRCTPQSIASHSLYENADPFLLKEPDGTLDTTRARYEAVNERLVRVRGSEFIPAETYTIKLEGAELAGYQTILIGGVRDPYILRQLDDWLTRIRARIEWRVKDVTGLAPDEYALNIRVYGKNGTMGALEPVQEFQGHEACLIFEVTAQTQELASTIAAMTRHQAIHFPIPEWSGLITGVACPYSPAYIERGATYRFNVNHVVEPDNAYEMFPIEIVEI
ncbi:acyclic terpene utilization AtuA family protein [Halomonas salipaludis]|uniref:Acyclic terpene utilisation N-terminal domain-containing protein n=1 Tax=Halomonas salipaludis TaxID=2032625 RepID=A0A2A2ET44_9GAMM|nr:acyclic terpene utilization AtuA family protein [Halomonas salipaludis]PAU75585.1 hypothetical protein CK498_16810 [Halomonas salipaludis]